MEQQTAYEVLIIGGGINGAGIARDLALRGVHTLLLEKGDFGGGTTAYSTRLIHGGLRYLEFADFGLVRESLRERKTLLKIASHLVFPLPFVLPVYPYHRYSRFSLRVGMALYDLLSWDKRLPNHRNCSAPEVRSRITGLNPDGLRGGFSYYDGQVPLPERLALANILDAERHGATCLNYQNAKKISRTRDGVFVVQAEDRTTDEQTEYRAQVLINATGPWLNTVACLIDQQCPQLVGGTKGSHLIVANTIGLDAAVYTPAKSDGRPFFIVPFGRSHLLIGTTDIVFSEAPDRALATRAEVQYLLDESNQVFPALELGPDDIITTYCGVRPLPPAKGKRPGAITRKHIVHRNRIAGRPAKMLSLVGGKITTYRELAEEAADAAVELLGRPAGPCITGRALLPGALPEPLDDGRFAARTFVQLSDDALLLFGRGKEKIRQIAAQEKAGADGVEANLAAAAVHAAQAEKVRHLDDFLLRRTMIGLQTGADRTVAENYAACLAGPLGWETGRVREEVSRYMAYMQKAMQWREAW